ncbi:TonB-dependent receptor [Parvibaculum sp.]|uniref:TonB-dependent receptor n=1 Tax=Parvibaculum sp. TaxID=2024848 RepID=UPI002C47B752|nr:TonB-dependent receptor [Parvibaculum sp.]HUD52494.1 TonB-dependent receptor [Parvibaculum sp.]
MKIRSLMLSTASLLLCMTAAAVAADAASGAPKDAADTESAGKPADTGTQAVAGGIEEVTVTARRRSERLKDVPASVTPLSGDQLDQLGVESTKDLLQQVAGAALVSSGPDYLSDISMRGQGSGRNAFSETATGLYQNGAYIAGGGFNGRAPSEIQLFDLDRVEVLHGPQGALYGRNAVGGAVNMIANRPEMDFSAKERVSYGSYDSYDAMGIVNAPLDPENGIAARIGVFSNNQEGGAITNLTTGNEVDWSRSHGARVGVSIEPNSDTKVYAQLEYYRSDQPSMTALGYVPVHAFAGTSQTGTPLDPDPYTRSDLNREGRARTRDLSGFFSFDKVTDIGDLSMKLYRRTRHGSREDDDYDHFLSLSGSAPGGVPMDIAWDQSERYDLVNAQLTLASNDFGRFKWLFGLEALQSDDDVETGIGECGAYNPGAQTAADLNPGCTPGYTGAPLDAAALAAARAAMNHDTSTETLNSVAAFGTLSYDITSEWTAGVEARIAKDMKSYDFERYSQDPLAYFGSGPAPAGHAPSTPNTAYCPPSVIAAGQCTGAGKSGFNAHLDADWSQFLPAASIRYKPSPTQTFYLRYATGYRPGGFNAPTSPVQTTYAPERSTSYELGWKGKLFDYLDADTSIYYQVTRDVQVTTYGGSGALVIIQTPGNGYVYGIESNLRKKFDVGPGVLNVALGLSSDYGRYYDAQTIQMTPGVFADINGNRIPRTADIQGALGASYVMPVFGDLQAMFGGSWQFSSGGYETPDNSRDYASYGKLDLRASLMASDRWSITAFGKNVLDRRYRMQTVVYNEYWSQPATFGISLTLMQ